MKKDGFISGLAAYFLWGILPLFWHLLSGVDAMVILANRILWSAVFTCGLFLLRGRFGEVLAAIKNKSLMTYLLPAAVAVTVNWGVYIWAVNAGHVMDSSLGYYMNPLISGVIGVMLFHERCTALGWTAYGLAFLGVVICVWAFGSFPWVALILAASFALYGALKKKCGAGGLVSIAVETLCLAPWALLYLLFSAEGRDAMLSLSAGNALLLIAAGPITSIPLALYTKGVNQLPFTTMAFFQYICPTLMLVTGFVFFGESFTASTLTAFAFIWAGLILFTADVIRKSSKLTVR